MKTDSLEYAETPRLAIWTGIAIALGIVLHRVFFLIAAVITLAGPFRCLAHRLADGAVRTGQPRNA